MCELRVLSFVIYLVLTLARGLPVEDTVLPLKTSDIRSDQEGENSGHSVEIIPATSIEFDGSPYSFNHGPPPRGNADHSVELEAGSQVYFPSFASLFEPRQPLRLNYPNQEGAFSQRPNSYRALLNNNNFPIFNPSARTSDKPFGKYTAAATPDTSSAILGSGNFAVIPGGTFFARNDEDGGGYGFDSFYNNGHGGPSPYFNNPSPNYNQEQFANFRDFAEINTPANSAYSHFVVVYANKNGTVESVKDPSKTTTNEPRNIIETLTLLDNDRPVDTTPWPAVAKTTKLSKTKAKLANTKLETKKWKQNDKNPTLENKVEFDEPLLALS